MSIITNLDDESAGKYRGFTQCPFKTFSGSEFFTSTDKIEKDRNNYIYGPCKFKDKISNIPEGAKVKVKSRHDDFAMVFVKHENTITRYGFCVKFNEEIDDFEFLIMHEQAINSRIST